MTKQKVEWALEIARRGFFILPLGANTKRPDTLWKNLRTCDPDRIRAWFDADPDMNYGVCPGSGGAIIDIDTGKVKRDGRMTDGIATFDKLEREQDIEDIVRGRTFAVRSPSSGLHLYVTTGEPVTNHSGFGLDVDVRGEGGYVVGPGCYYNGKDKIGDIAGFYEVEFDAPFMAAPKWCVDKMRADILRDADGPDLIELDLPSSISQGKEFLAHYAPAREGMPGGGDLWTYRCACVLCYNYGLTKDTALDLAANYKFLKAGETEPLSWNDRCEPPWDVYGTGNETLESKFRNGDAYGRGRRGNMSGALYFQGLDPETLAEAAQAAIDMSVEADSKRARLEDHMLRGTAIYQRIPPMRWIIPFWLPGAGITGIVGESGIGKSTLLLDLALRLAHDMEWHETPTRKGMSVVYTCGEDYEGAVLQMRAWCKTHSIMDEPSQSRFVFMPEVPPFASVDEVNLWTEVLRDKVGTRDVVVFIDTWQRATAGLSQNEERDMQGAINMAESLGRAVGGPVVAAFHSPKSNRETISGWEGQRNTSNALWFMESDARGVKLTAKKVRCGARDNFIVFDFKETDAGIKDEYFGFDLKHVVPHRVAGMRITTDGMIYKEENLTTVRRAIAQVLYSLESRRADDTSAQSEYSVRHAAERIVGHPERPTLGRPPLVDTPDDPWAVELVTKLRDGGIRFPVSFADMMKLIQDTIGPAGYTFEDGCRVYIHRTGNKDRICVDNGALTV